MTEAPIKDELSELDSDNNNLGTVHTKIDFPQILLRTLMKIARSFSYRTTDPSSGLVFKDTVKTLDVLLYPYEDSSYDKQLQLELQLVNERYKRLDPIQYKARSGDHDIDKHTARLKCLMSLMKRRGFLPDLGRTTYL